MKNNLIKILILVSSICFFLLVNIGTNNKIIIIFNFIITLFSVFILLYKCNFLNILKNKKYTFNKYIDNFLAILLSLNTSKILAKYFISSDNLLNYYVNKMFGLLFNDYDKLHVIFNFCVQLFSIIILYLLWITFVKYVLSYVKKFFANLSNIEKKYFIVFNIIFIIISIIINLNTSMFTLSKNISGEYVLHDILYTTDTGIHIYDNSFEKLNAVENDLRQPLFAVISFPFSQVADLISTIFVTFPKSLTYSLTLVLLQGMAMSVISILLSRLSNKTKDDLLFMFGFNIIFSSLLLTFNIEQYIFGILYLIVLFYFLLKHNKTNPILYALCGGSLLTNFAVLPFIVKFNSFKKWFLTCFKYGVYSLLIIALFGQTYNIYKGIVNFANLKIFMGTSISFVDKLYQYINFVSSIFVAPKAHTDISSINNNIYVLDNVTNINYLGLFIIIICFISVLINRKNKLVLVSFFWAIFSFIILCIVGWGTKENGLIIYSLYFGWPFYIIVYHFIKSVFSFNKTICNIFIIILLIILFIVNLNEIINIINFGIKYYPVYYK